MHAALSRLEAGRDPMALGILVFILMCLSFYFEVFGSWDVGGLVPSNAACLWTKASEGVGEFVWQAGVG